MSTESGLLADDLRARSEALDVSRSFIVQAPAGSGKTELLIQRYLRLLATVDNPEEVIAITFTRKAAAEMRMRVLQALERAERGETPTEAHLKVTAEAADLVLRRDARFNWQLIVNPRRLRIQTLDSLNASIARMQPLTASTASTGSRVADEGEMNALYEEAAAATLDWLADDGASGAATEEVLKHVDGNTGIYIGYLARMLKTRDQWLPFVSAGTVDDAEAEALRRTFEGSLERVVRKRLEQLRIVMPTGLMVSLAELVVYAVDNLHADGKDDHPVCSFGHTPETLATDPADLPRWHALAELLLTKKGAVRKQVNKNLGFPAGDDGQKAAMHSILEEIEDEDAFVELLHTARILPPVRYSDEQWSVLLALFRLLPVGVAELRRLCVARGLTDHIEIALAAAEAVGTAENPGDVALLLDYQVRHILVDEMQDTSKAQYRMLEALTGGWEPGDGRTLFCVGDPMQSIYRFRNAEVAQFLLARGNGIGSVHLEPLTLRRNFRSGEHLVHWFNEVFPRVLPARDDPVNSAVSYAPAVPVEPLAGQGEVGVHPLFGGSVDAEADVGVDVIHRLLDADAEATVAVLVRSRTQLPALLLRLRAARIAYQAIDIDRLTDLPEIIDVLALTRASAHRGDRVAWLGLLRSPWIGLNWEDIHTLVAGVPGKTVHELINDEMRLGTLSEGGRRQVEHALPILNGLVDADRSTPLVQRIERAWFALGGPALLDDDNAVANVYRYFDAVAKLDVGGTIPDISELMDRLDAERVSTNTAARLQILTMHKAKGLQFDHVVLYGLGRYPSPRDRDVMSWFDLPDIHGVEEKVISPVGRRDAVERDPVHRFIDLTEAAKDRHEEGRLLYVACTRARRSLHLLGNVSVASDGSTFNRPHAKSLLVRLWNTVERDYVAAFDDAEVEKSGERAADHLRPVLRRFDRPWAAPEAAAVPGQSPSQAVDETSRVEYYWVGVNARLAGTAVHRWLQLAAEKRVRLDPGQLEALRPVTERWLQELGAGAESLATIWERVRASLAGVLDDARGQWLIDGPGEAELALNGVIDGRDESIIIDRIRIDGDTHWIVDYKTSSHEGGDLDGFLAAEVERYSAQLDKYARVYAAFRNVEVRCALYFPLLGRFVEVPTNL